MWHEIPSVSFICCHKLEEELLKSEGGQLTAMTAVCLAFGQMMALRPCLMGKLHCTKLWVDFSTAASPGGRGSGRSASPAMAVRGLEGPAGVVCAPQVSIISLCPLMFSQK